jgi:hypothetical protein
MKVFLRVIAYALFGAVVITIAHNFLTPRGLSIFQDVLDWVALPGYIYIGWILSNWWRARQKMSFIYNRHTDEGVMFVVPKSKKYVPIRPEALVNGTVFNYDRETGELHSVYVQGVNNIKSEEQDDELIH